MADMQLVLKLIAEAQSAVAGLKSVTAAVKETGTEAVKVEGDARGMGVVIVQAGDQSAAAVEALSAKLATAQARIEALGREIAGLKSLPPATIPDTERFGRAAGEASRQAGYMAAQWNDMVMMALAGQNPMQLAIQQGSQITQAFGPGGASGALRSVGAGFMSMLTPMNLATYAAIALGTALVQALMAGGAQVKTLEEAVKDLEASVKSMAEQGDVSLEDLKKKYGEVTPEVIRLNKEMSDLAGVQGILAATAALQALKAETEGSWWAAFNDKALSDAGTVADMLQVRMQQPAGDGMSIETNPLVTRFQDAVTEASQAKGWDAQIAAVREVQDVIIEAAGGIDKMTLKQSELLAKMQATEAALRQQKALHEGTASAEERANDAARETMETIATEAKIKAASLKYGEDSLVVANLRVEAERAAFHATVDASQASADVKDQLKAAWDNANGFANVQMHEAAAFAAQVASDLELWLSKSLDSAEGIGNADLAAGIRAAIGPAWELAKALWDGVTASVAQNDFVKTSSGQYVRRDQFFAGMKGRGMPSEGGMAPVVDVTPVVPKGAGDGGGGGATDSLGSLSERAAKVMQQLDDALASVDLKANAGIMSAAEAADAVTSAKERAADELADLIPELERLGPSGAKAAAEAKDAFGALAETIKGVGGDIQDLSEELSSGFKAPFADFIAGTKQGADAWDDFLGNLNRTIAQKLSNKVTDNLLNPIFDGLLGSLGGLGLNFFADGGVPGISDFSGQVLSQPTLFAMPGGGMGQMAEAGPEAIMPVQQGPGGLSVRAISGGRETLLGLTRASDGKLGVQLPDYQPADWSDPATIAPRRFANGGVIGGQVASQELVTARGAPGASGASGMGPGGQISSTIIINNNVPEAAPTVKERFEGNNKITTIMIDAVRDALADDLSSGRGPVPPALEQAFGLARRGR